MRRITQGEYNEELRALILKNFHEIHVLTDEEVSDDFTVWERARKLFPGLEETLEDARFALMRDLCVVSSEAIGTEYRKSDVLRYLTAKEAAACMTNEYAACYIPSLHDLHVRDANKKIVNWYDGNYRHPPRDPMEPSGGKRRWRRTTMQTGVI